MALSLDGTTGITSDGGTPVIENLDTTATGIAVTGQLTTTGNVGIGTSSPSTYVNSQGTTLVVGTSPNFATIQGRTDGPSGSTNGVSYGGSYSTNSLNGARIFIGAAGGAGQQGLITFNTKNLNDDSTQPAERMRIDPAGLVSIGISTPQAQLHLSGNSDTTPAIKIGTATFGHRFYDSSANGDLVYKRELSGTEYEVMRFSRANGNLLVGTPSVSHLGDGFTLSGNGGTTKWHCGPRSSQPNQFVISAQSGGGVYLTTTSATSWSSASDERLKDIIEPIVDGLQKVCTLRTVIGSYKADAEKNRRPFLIAQDLQKVFPEAVDTSDPDRLGVQYTEVIPLLVAAIKEQQVLITQQAAAIDDLTARVSALEA